MTDEVNNQEQVSAEQSIPAAPAHEKVDNSANNVPQSTVNEIVGNAKKDSYEKGRRDALLEAQANAKPVVTEPKQTQSFDEDKARQLIDAEIDRRATQKAAEQVVNEFAGKVRAGKSLHTDYEEKIQELNIPDLPPQMIHYVNGVDNTADVLYELANHPSKFANIVSLSVANGNLAKKALSDLSASIKQNKDAITKAKENNVNAPLDKVTPSTTGTDNGSLSVSDLRKQPWLRG